MSAFIAFFSLYILGKYGSRTPFTSRVVESCAKTFLYLFPLVSRPLTYQTNTHELSLAAISINSTIWQIRAFSCKPESHFLRRQISFTSGFLLRPYPIITKKRYFLYGPSCFWKSRSEKLRLTWTPDKQYVQYLIKEPFPVLVYPIRLKQDLCL